MGWRTYTTNERDKAGSVTPLLHLGPLVLGLLLNRQGPVSFLPRVAPRGLGWPLFGSRALLMGWFFFTMRRRHHDRLYRAGVEPGYGWALPLHLQPRLHVDGHDLRGDIQHRERYWRRCS